MLYFLIYNTYNYNIILTLFKKFIKNSKILKFINSYLIIKILLKYNDLKLLTLKFKFTRNYSINNNILDYLQNLIFFNHLLIIIKKKIIKEN